MQIFDGGYYKTWNYETNQFWLKEHGDYNSWIFDNNPKNGIKVMLIMRKNKYAEKDLEYKYCLLSAT